MREWLMENGFIADNHGWYSKNGVMWYYWGGFVWYGGKFIQEANDKNTFSKLYKKLTGIELNEQPA